MSVCISIVIVIVSVPWTNCILISRNSKIIWFLIDKKFDLHLIHIYEIPAHFKFKIPYLDDTVSYLCFLPGQLSVLMDKKYKMLLSPCHCKSQWGRFHIHN